MGDKKSTFPENIKNFFRYGEEMKNKASLKQLLFLQGAVIIYTLSGIMAKLASSSEGAFGLFLFFGLDLFFLGIYALAWQQLIKHLPLSVAYANRAMALLWSALWAKLFFREIMGIKQLVGIGMVILGILMVNSRERMKEEK